MIKVIQVFLVLVLGFVSAQNVGGTPRDREGVGNGGRDAGGNRSGLRCFSLSGIELTGNAITVDVEGDGRLGAGDMSISSGGDQFVPTDVLPFNSPDGKIRIHGLLMQFVRF